jgi:hypothetical protein
VKVVKHGEEDALFAVEVQIEGAARYPRSSDDLGNTRASVPSAGKDPRRGVEKLATPGIARDESPLISN